MKAMLLRALAPLSQNPAPLSLSEMPKPGIRSGEVLIRVSACGVCHTELDEIEGRTPPPQLPIILGHQVAGTIVEGKHSGKRVGVAWIASADGTCKFCRSHQENLCPQFRATGRDVNGGYAEYMTVREDFYHHIPESISDSEAAPLLCAGAIGYRSMMLANMKDAQTLGLMGFGASGHLVLKMVKYKYPNSKVFVFSRSLEEQQFASSLGATWTGAITDEPPNNMDAVIDTTPVWTPILRSLKHLEPGGRVVVNAIRKEELDKSALLNWDYPAELWMEKEIKSVANVTRADVREFLDLAANANIRPEIQEYPLEEANRALVEIKSGKIRGAKVLRM
jgi:alcohol dehydrogenase, propanol-preferring